MKKALFLLMLNCILFRIFYQELRVNTGKLTKTLFGSWFCDYGVAAKLRTELSTYYGRTSPSFESNLEINLNCTI